jgi:hypothetical protein
MILAKAKAQLEVADIKSTPRPPEETKYIPEESGNKYHRVLVSLEGIQVTTDVYRFLLAFNVTDPGVQHAIKKLLMPGERGSKGYIDDLKEAIVAIDASILYAEQSM